MANRAAPKASKTFCPLGPVLVTPDEIPNPNALRLRTLVNGEVLQNSNTSDMIFDIPTLIEFLSGSTTLLPGTAILTGTPSVVGMTRQPQWWLNPGDTVTIEIEQIGNLTNPVIAEPLRTGPFGRCRATRPFLNPSVGRAVPARRRCYLAG